MTHADIVKVFTFNKLTKEQETDLAELHSAAQDLAVAIYKIVHPQHAQQAIGQLTALLGQCRTSIELQPRAGESRIKMVTN